MRDAAFVKACELVVEFRKQASHWKKLLFATSEGGGYILRDCPTMTHPVSADALKRMRARAFC